MQVRIGYNHSINANKIIRNIGCHLKDYATGKRYGFCRRVDTMLDEHV